MFRERAKKKYSKDQKLVKSILDKIQESRDIPQSSLRNLEDMYIHLKGDLSIIFE